ncbi:hypothetical protein [Glycomyces artemisiae]|uniref:Uncharacterized protein n=1 Tax=Glycomyces artemisiae TaxID=1076443 RepID=A0A2T0UES7_9ACTN|nr:hypothetical protein [Glycomyces artemisiae]PRY56402.1 hypothetical protein B0I28_10951 [Glycomyces artemisiae]
MHKNSVEARPSEPQAPIKVWQRDSTRITLVPAGAGAAGLVVDTYWGDGPRDAGNVDLVDGAYVAVLNEVGHDLVGQGWVDRVAEEIDTAMTEWIAR